MEPAVLAMTGVSNEKRPEKILTLRTVFIFGCAVQKLEVPLMGQSKVTLLLWRPCSVASKKRNKPN